MANIAIVGGAWPGLVLTGGVPLVPPVESTPTIEGYTNWIRTIMGVPVEALADDSPYIPLSYNISVSTVNYYLGCVSGLLYTQAVYALGGDILCNIVQDDPDATPPYNTYWSDLRAKLGVNNFTPGMINAANDEDTSAAILTPASLQNLTLADMQNLKTPWGRMYLQIAQSVGTLWGLS
jgi:hypothetical protein